jgi:hypothetical protein
VGDSRLRNLTFSSVSATDSLMKRKINKINDIELMMEESLVG